MLKLISEYMYLSSDTESKIYLDHIFKPVDCDNNVKLLMFRSEEIQKEEKYFQNYILLNCKNLHKKQSL